MVGSSEIQSDTSSLNQQNDFNSEEMIMIWIFTLRLSSITLGEF